MSFTPDRRGMDKLLHSNSGPVVRWLDDLGKRVANGARARVGVASGRTRRAITHRLGPFYPNPTVRIGVLDRGGKVGVAYFHHQGTRPHLIHPKPPKNILVFRGRSGQMVFIRPPRFVRHPGTKPNPYLIDAAAAEGIRIKTTTTRR